MDDKTFQLQERIRNIEAELAEVKKELGIINTDGKKTKATAKKENFFAVERQTTVDKGIKKETKSAEQIIGDWLPRVFIFVFILGIIWAFIAAVDRGWISPAVRVLLGFGLSVVLYWAGNRQYNQTRSTLGIVLLGGSIVVYTVAIFAGNILYGIISYPLTLLLLGIGMYIGVWMSRKYTSQSLLAIIGVGAYIYPFLFAGDTGSEKIFYLYETLIFAGLIIESLRKHYKVTWNIANYAFIFTVLFFSIIGAGYTSSLTFFTLVFQQLLIIYLTFRVNNSASKEMYISAIATGAFFMYLIGEEVFGSTQTELFTFYLLMVSVYGLLSIVKSTSYSEIKNIFFIFSMFYLFLFFSELFTEAEYIRLITHTIQAVAMYYISQKRNSRLGTVVSFILLLPVIGRLLDLPGYLFTPLLIICWLLVIGFFLTIYLYKERSTVLRKSLVKNVSPYVIAALILVFFSKIAALITQGGSYTDDSIGLSISWMVFVAVIYMAYSFFKEKQWNYLGLSFLIITLGKITLYDLAAVDIVWRAILFIILGIIGLFISRIFYNKDAVK